MCSKALMYLALLALLGLCGGTPHRVQLSRSQRKPATSTLTNVNNYYYTVLVQIGNQQFDLLLDTGSATTWVTSALCWSNACSLQQQYDRRSSPSYQGTYRVPFTLSYADNSQETAVYSLDSITVAGLKVKSQCFGEASYYRSGDNINGIFGMGPDSQVIRAGGLKPPTFLTSLQKDGTISKRVFSLCLTGGDGSVLTIGDVDTSLYTGSITYAPQETYYNSWTVSADSISVGDDTICYNCSAVIDSGTSIIVVPAQYITSFLENIPEIQQSGRQLYVDCSQVDQLPSLQVSIAGTQLTLNPTDYVEMSDEGGICSVLISTKNFPQWILGDPFLRKYYTVFDADNKQIGFANSNCKSQ